jgi:hypothetical protein
VKITGIQGVDMLITDADADGHAVADLQALGLDVVCV